jgi:hypothetical protein
MASSADMNNTEESFNTFGGIAFDQRKANAARAYFEWMPIRQVDLDDNLRYFSLGMLTVVFGGTFQWVRCLIWLSLIPDNMIGRLPVSSPAMSLIRPVLEYGIYLENCQ